MKSMLLELKFIKFYRFGW